MRQLTIRLAFLSLYAMGTMAAAMLPAAAPTDPALAGFVPVAQIGSPEVRASQDVPGIPPVATATERPHRAARIDFSMPYYRFGRLPMRL